MNSTKYLKSRILPYNAAKRRACPGCYKWEAYTAAEVVAAAAFWTLGERERCLRGFCLDHQVEFAAALLKADAR